MDKESRVQILIPPMFTKSGIVRDRKEAWANKEWMGTFNLWIVQKNPVPSIVYQLRSPTIGWAPNKLDVAAGGHYEDLETIEEGLREAKEELNKDFDFKNLVPLGRKLSVGVSSDGTQRNTVIDLFLTEDESPLDTYELEEQEVFAICTCPLDELYKVHTIDGYSFKVKAKKFDKSDIEIEVTKDIFPPNWDNYHFKMVMLIQRYFNSEKNLLY